MTLLVVALQVNILLVSSYDNFPSGSTVCILPSGKYTNLTDCTSGEVFLMGKYVNIGMHNVGSFGTVSSLNTEYYQAQLGFLADYDKNGFISQSGPGFSGDYFVPGIPLEGI